MAWMDTISTGLLWAAFAGFTLNVGLLLYIRSRSRATLVVDTMLRLSAPLALIQLILIGTDLLAGHAAPGSMWVLIQSIFFGLSLYMLVPSFFMARVASHTDDYIIVSRGLLNGLHEKLDELYGPSPARLITYGVGKKAGHRDAAQVLGAGILRGARMWRWLPYVFRLTGLGKAEYLRLAPGVEVRLRVTRSFEVFHHHADGVPGCDITRGYLAGIGLATHPDQECQAEEVHCAQAEGGDTCEFVVRWFAPVPPVSVVVRTAEA